MITDVINWLGGIAQQLIDTFGYAGIFFGMLIETVNVPLPSEAIMTFAGALVANGKFDFWIVVLVGSLGNVVGSSINYYLGARGGRPFLEKYGKYALLYPGDLERGDRWFQRYGLWAVFLTRMLPIIRTFISFPAGVARVPFIPFAVLTFVGSFLWCILLTYLGVLLGENYEDKVRPILQKFDLLIGVLIVLGIVWFVRRHFRDRH